MDIVTWLKNQYPPDTLVITDTLTNKTYAPINQYGGIGNQTYGPPAPSQKSMNPLVLLVGFLLVFLLIER